MQTWLEFNLEFGDPSRGMWRFHYSSRVYNLSALNYSLDALKYNWTTLVYKWDTLRSKIRHTTEIHSKYSWDMLKYD